MSSHTIEDLTSCILDFQANMVRVTFRNKMTLIEPDFEPLQSAALQFIWASSYQHEDREDPVTAVKWRKVGFETEDIGHEFREVGVLGLDCLVGRSLAADGASRIGAGTEAAHRNTLWRRTPSTGRRWCKNS